MRRCGAGAREPPAPRTCGTSSRTRPPAAAGHHRPQLDRRVVTYDVIGRDEIVTADHQYRLGQDVELAQDVFHPAVAGNVDFSTGISQDDFHQCTGALLEYTPVQRADGAVSRPRARAKSHAV